jgi:hypothetical protein
VSEYIEWQYLAHVRFGEMLNYFFIPFTQSYDRAAVSNALKEFLFDEGIEDYTFQEVYGTFDIVLRAYLPATRVGSVRESLTRNLNEGGLSPGNIEVFHVENTAYHWLWPNRGLRRGGMPNDAAAEARLNRLTIAEVMNVHEGNNPNLLNELQQQGLLRMVEEMEGIRFFVSIPPPIANLGPAAAHLRQDLLKVLRASPESGRMVLYEGIGFQIKYIIEGLVGTANFPLIADLNDAINESGMHKYGVKPTTYIAIKPTGGTVRRGGFIKQLTADEPQIEYDAKHYLTRPEGSDLEHKASLNYDFGKYLATGTIEKNDALVTSCLKTVVAFLNTPRKGGCLLIGVAEDRKFKQFESKLQEYPLVGDLRVVGIRWEYRGQTWDEYQLKLMNLVQIHIGPHYSSYISLRRLTYEDRDLCLVEVSHLPEDQWAYLDKRQFYIRAGGGTQMLEGLDMELYQKQAPRSAQRHDKDFS